MARPIRRDRDENNHDHDHKAANYMVCNTCGGIGYLIKQPRQRGDNHVQFEYTECPRCKGTGQK